MEHYDYIDTMVSFANAIDEEGVVRVAEDFRRYYPTQNAAFVTAALQINKQQQVAALFKPVLPKEL